MPSTFFLLFPLSGELLLCADVNLCNFVYAEVYVHFPRQTAATWERERECGKFRERIFSSTFHESRKSSLWVNVGFRHSLKGWGRAREREKEEKSFSAFMIQSRLEGAKWSQQSLILSVRAYFVLITRTNFSRLKGNLLSSVELSPRSQWIRIISFAHRRVLARAIWKRILEFPQPPLPSPQKSYTVAHFTCHPPPVCVVVVDSTKREQ